MPGQNRRDNGARGAIWPAEGADRSARALLTSSDRDESQRGQQGSLHALILPRPTQTRNSGRAEHCLVVQRQGCPKTKRQVAEAQGRASVRHRSRRPSGMPMR